LTNAKPHDDQIYSRSHDEPLYISINTQQRNVPYQTHNKSYFYFTLKTDHLIYDKTFNM